jgi:hypothetical protein
VLALAGAACSGSDGPGDEAKATTTVPPAPAILTGLPLDDPGHRDRPVLSVKIDNVPQARPQAGIEAADVVYEEMVEGGFTRFLAVFQSTDAPLLGPVRSVRPVDPQLMAPLKGGFAYSGGIPVFVALLRRAPVVDVGFSALNEAYERRKGRRAPHNVFTSTDALYEGVDGQPAPPPLFPFLRAGQAFAPAGSTPVARFSVTFGSRVHDEFVWDAARDGWRRSVNGQPHTVEGGAQLVPTTVIVQFVRYEGTGQKDQSHSEVFTADTVGQGEAWVFAGGRVLKGRWSRATQGEVLSYADAAGHRLSIPPGRTWVLLPNVGSPTEVVAPPPPTTTTTTAD